MPEAPALSRPTISGRTELVLCECLGVTEAEVLDTIATLDLRTLQEVRHCTGAGTGCNACHAKIRECIEAAEAACGFAGMER